MTMAMRMVSGLLLSLLLALSSVSMAVARGQAVSGMELVLCTPSGVETVVLDAKGNPVPATRHLCPDCVTGSALPAQTRAPVVAPLRLPLRALSPALPPDDLSEGREPASQRARGPPSLV